MIWRTEHWKSVPQNRIQKKRSEEKKKRRRQPKKNLQPRTLYSRLLFKFDEEIKSFTEKQNLREFSSTKPAVQQTLKEFF